MPKRGAIALAFTTLALVLLFAFKTPDVAPIGAGRNTALVQPAASSAPAATTGPAAAPVSAANPAANAAPLSPSVTAAPAAGSGGTALANGTLTGSVVQTRFGPVQVQVTIACWKISAVTALQLPSDRQRSAEISGIVEPMLRSEALTAQSAQIDLISGATYTSDAYAQSLQSALDQAAHGLAFRHGGAHLHDGQSVFSGPARSRVTRGRIRDPLGWNPRNRGSQACWHVDGGGWRPLALFEQVAVLGPNEVWLYPASRLKPRLGSSYERRVPCGRGQEWWGERARGRSN